MAKLTREQEKAIHAKKHDPVMERHLNIQRLLAKTSGKFGMKQGKDFEMHGGKVVTMSEKKRLVELKLQKEKEKMMKK